MNRASAPGAPLVDGLQIDHLQVLLQSRSIIACYKSISKLARSWPPSVSPTWLDHSLQVHLSVHSISASRCIAKLSRSRPLTLSLSSLNLDLQLHLHTRLITASECNSEFTQSSFSCANPIRHIMPLTSHICSYHPYSFPSSSPISCSPPSSQNTMLCHPSLYLHAMIMSLHWVQHTPSTAYTQDCLSSLHSHDGKLTPECSFSFRCASLQARLPPASSPWEVKVKVTSSHSHSCELTNWWIELQHPACLLSTTPKHSNLGRS